MDFLKYKKPFLGAGKHEWPVCNMKMGIWIFGHGGMIIFLVNHRA